VPELDIGHAIGLEPTEAVKYLRSMGVSVASNWREAEAAARNHSLAISGVTQIGVTADIHAALVQAMAKGQTADQFIAGLKPKLESAGWLGGNARAPGGKVDAKTGEITLDGRGYSRLKFIYGEHMANAYAAAKDGYARSNGATRWQYSAVLDSRTRPMHRAMHGKMFRMDDAGAEAFKARNGFRCRCTNIYFWDTPEQAAQTPSVQTREVQVPQRGGAERSVLELVDDKLPGGVFRPDVGFDQPPGAAWQRAVSNYALDKAGDLPPALGALASYRQLQRPGVLEDLTRAWGQFAEPMIPKSASDVIHARGELFVLGALFPDVVAAVQARGITLQTAALSILDSKVAHMLRTAKAAPLPRDWVLDLPRHLFDGPSIVILERERLVLWFDLPGQAGKLAVSVNGNVKVAGAKRKENLIESGGVMSLTTAADVLTKATVVWRK
jgi:SPP1 gp7 family putative phage head morphogenesis protein